MNNAYLPKPYKIISIHKETEIDWTFEIEYSGALIGGQFMEISLPGIGEAPISISEFDEHSLWMTIRKVGKLTDQLFEANPGDVIFMRGPYGNGFNLDWFKGKSVAIIAGGTGLAPVRKTIAQFVEHPEWVKSLEVMVGFKSSQDVLFEKTLEAWQSKTKLWVTIDKEEPNWNGLTGLITTHLSKLDLSEASQKTVIVVGPPIMMKFTTLELMKLGILEENIWVSFERKMSCGIGKCGHCKIDETYVCLEGPVFPYTKAKHLID